MAQCIVYLRVSTRAQALGHGLIRQLEACQEFAKAGGLWVRAVYVDICSGSGQMPQRELAISEAEQHGIRILVESRDRWSRSKKDKHAQSALPISCAEYTVGFEREIAEIIHKHTRGVANGNQ